MAGTRHDSNQELIGQGMANIIAPLLGGFAATGAIARTTTNIPLCVLAAILFVVAWNMSEAKHFTHIVRRAPGQTSSYCTTFLLTVFVNLVVAVNIGVILAMFQFLRRMASSVEVQQMTEQEIQGESLQLQPVSLPAGVLVFSMDGPFFFGAVENFERALLQTHTDPDTLIIRLKRVPFIDLTGLQTLEEAIRQFQKRGIPVLLCEATPRVKAKLEKAGILSLTGSERYFEHLGDAIEYCNSKNRVK